MCVDTGHIPRLLCIVEIKDSTEAIAELINKVGFFSTCFSFPLLCSFLSSAEAFSVVDDVCAAALSFFVLVVSPVLLVVCSLLALEVFLASHDS